MRFDYLDGSMTLSIAKELVSFSEHDGVIHSVYLSPVIDLSIARSIVAERKKSLGLSPRPFLIEGTRLGSITKEARDYFASSEGKEGVASAAFLVKSNFQASMLNFFLKVTRQDMPVRMFTDKDRAHAWCKSIRAQDERQ